MVFSFAASQWTGLVKSLVESAYALSLNIRDTATKAAPPDYNATSSAASSTAITTSTVEALTSSVTIATMNSDQIPIKSVNLATYSSGQPTLGV
jgi:hypothetical protein